MTARPTCKDIEVRERAAREALPAVIDWMGDDFNEADRERILAELANAFEEDHDGYTICRCLDEEYAWSPDSELVDILDYQYLADAEYEGVVEWVKENHPTPLHQVGDEVSFNWYGGTWTAGIITQIFQENASYWIRMDHQQTFAMIPFEAVSLLRRAELETPESDEKLPDMADQQDSLE